MSTAAPGDRISVLGVGTSGLPAAGAKEGAATLEMALEQGINYFDLATADSACFPIFGAALAGVRRQVLYQVHFGANYAAGKPYSWTTDLETVKRSVAWQLEQLRTDYIDYGFIHCMDEVRRLAPVCGQRRSSVSGGAESPGRRPPHRPLHPYAGPGPGGAGHRPGGHDDVQHQPQLRLSARRVCQRQRHGADGPFTAGARRRAWASP